MTSPRALCPRAIRPSTTLKTPKPLFRSPYHSYEHTPPPPFSPAETAILSAALARVPEHGFSQAALSSGARDAGYLDASVNLLPRGVFDLVNYHLVTQRLGLKDRVQFPEPEAGKKGMGVGTKVRALTLERLRANGEIISRWQEALAVMALPRNVGPSIAELARLSDEIWFLAGDTSVDASWYTKRASLSAVYSSTELFMTTDRSEGWAETEHFLDRRLEEVRNVGGAIGNIGEWVGFTGASVLNVLRSKGVKI
jgi:ubiquinone biosynthesis protein COQ9